MSLSAGRIHHVMCCFSAKKCRENTKHCYKHDVLEPFKQALLASRDVIISSQISSSKLQRVVTLGDGCWLPTLALPMLLSCGPIVAIDARHLILLLPLVTLQRLFTGRCQGHARSEPNAAPKGNLPIISLHSLHSLRQRHCLIVVQAILAIWRACARGNGSQTGGTPFWRRRACSSDGSFKPES